MKLSDEIFGVAILFVLFAGLIMGIDTIVKENTATIITEIRFAGNIDGNLIDFAVKYHGEGNAHYSDSLGYWYFVRNGDKLRLINENVMKKWEEK